MEANGIDDVLRILDGILADCKAASDPLGYFPALHRQVTLTVKQGIATGFFADGPRMDRFDALFANRYFAAYEAFRSGGSPSKSWQVAFQSTQSGQLILALLLAASGAAVLFKRRRNSAVVGYCDAESSRLRRSP